MTPEAKAARERKQKIFVVVGGLLLLALLAFQLPKLLGGSSSPGAATTTSTGHATVSGQATTPTVGAPIAVTGAAPVAAVETAKITSFSLFAPKDPFVQQVETNNAVGASEGGGAATEKSGKTEEKAKEFATGKATSAATIVTVNGARQVLEPGTKFPAADPMFVLVAENLGSKSVVVGIVGGAYSGGARTTKLKIGKPLTLVNTTTGARYKISLVSVGSGDTSDKAAPATTP